LALINPQLTSDVRRKIQARLGTRLAPLPNPSPQMETLRALYGDPPASVILNGPKATEETFRRDAGKYRTIYVFSHGVFNNEDPMKSYVVLASTLGSNTDDKDGLLEAGELMTMRLRADLVILAGCETARGHIGRGEGMMGLAWALFVAGTPTVVVSQWRVPSGSTERLMIEFHRMLAAKSGTPSSRTGVAEALNYASLKTRSETRLKHPLYWAGFVVVGDGR